MTAQNIYTLKIGGQAGQGVKSVGLMFAKVATRSGYNIFDYTEYPSLIRGGHNVMQISFSKDEISGTTKDTNLLVALNQETIDRHWQELKTGSGVIINSEANLDTSKLSEDVTIYKLPLSQFTKESGGNELLINTAALGAVIALLNGDLSILKELIQEEFSDKDQKIVKTNQDIAELGFKYINENYSDYVKDLLTPITNLENKIIVSGNEAIALGAIAGGLQFACIYPMSPISNVLHVLALYQEKFGYIYKQPEDEISAINMAIGASIAGARSMTATSGGGFCLMTEGYGLAGMTETPLVIINGMRGGPATGLPTWSEQGDLQFVLNAHQGDFPKIVLAAGDSKEAFELTMKAFNLADKYQTPVVLLVDKNTLENDQSFPEFNFSTYKVDRGNFNPFKQNDFARYNLADNGISQRTVPGSGNFFIANSDEHDAIGYSTEEIKDRNDQMRKRMAKLQTATMEDMEDPVLYGPTDADITFVSWGSNKGSILQAIKDYPNVNYLHITWMSPFPEAAIKKHLEKAKYLINVECNYTGQLARLIKEKVGVDILDRMLRFDGRPFYPEDIVEKIETVFKRSYMNFPQIELVSSN